MGSTIQHRVSSDPKPGFTISIQIQSEKFHGYPDEMTLNQLPWLTRLEK